MVISPSGGEGCTPGHSTAIPIDGLPDRMLPAPESGRLWAKAERPGDQFGPTENQEIGYGKKAANRTNLAHRVYLLLPS